MLRLNKVSSGYDPTKQILKEIDFEISNGEIIAIMGLNGSGKSTLLRTCLGLLSPLHGEVLLNNKKLLSYTPHQRAQKISLLDSQTTIAFSMTVRELLELSISLHGKKELFALALEAVGLKGFEEKNLLELSSGETRRALIAHTLCTNAEIIMIDEPFAHLDWRHQEQLAQSLKSWNKKFNTTFVLAIHELEWIIQIAHTVCALGKGKILASGSPEYVFQSQLVCELFAFQARIDENPIDGSRRLTLGRPLK
ncbi:MAG: ABC transporter ATP-binding protein [Oligoflexia bacterium]|nr:ABC transporter ATP-binding protein [Oligoflexia bacterium]